MKNRVIGLVVGIGLAFGALTAVAWDNQNQDIYRVGVNQIYNPSGDRVTFNDAVGVVGNVTITGAVTVTAGSTYSGGITNTSLNGCTIDGGTAHNDGVWTNLTLNAPVIDGGTQNDTVMTNVTLQGPIVPTLAPGNILLKETVTVLGGTNAGVATVTNQCSTAGVRYYSAWLSETAGGAADGTDLTSITASTGAVLYGGGATVPYVVFATDATGKAVLVITVSVDHDRYLNVLTDNRNVTSSVLLPLNVP